MEAESKQDGKMVDGVWMGVVFGREGGIQGPATCGTSSPE